MPAAQTAEKREQGARRGSEVVSANEAALTSAPPLPPAQGLPALWLPGDPRALPRPYLSMMTGSEGVSLRFPQLFLSQQRLGRGAE